MWEVRGNVGWSTVDVLSTGAYTGRYYQGDYGGHPMSHKSSFLSKSDQFDVICLLIKVIRSNDIQAQLLLSTSFQVFHNKVDVCDVFFFNSAKIR